MNGFIIVNKARGPTSHDVVAHIRRLAGQRRVGHAGTLDPLASGVLVLALGPATRLNEYLLRSPKHYRATLRLGQITPSYDADTPVSETRAVTATRADFEAALPRFRGEIMQVPPIYSAIKRGGQRSYTLARKGKAVRLDPRPITIYRLDIVAWSLPDVMLDVACSSGAYIRSLAHDIGETLGCGAHLIALERTVAGPFTLEHSHTLDELELLFANGQGHTVLLPPTAALAGWPLVNLTDIDAQRLRQWQAIPLTEASGDLARACLSDGTLVAVVIADKEHNLWRPKKVFTGEA